MQTDVIEYVILICEIRLDTKKKKKTVWEEKDNIDPGSG